MFTVLESPEPPVTPTSGVGAGKVDGESEAFVSVFGFEEFSVFLECEDVWF